MKQEETYKLAVEVLDEYLSAGKFRRTNERYVILRQICNFPAHFTAEQLQILCVRELSVSRATIYNTLQLLLDAGLLTAHPLYAGSKTIAYELTTRKNNKMYFQCNRCGRVVEFEDKMISNTVKNHRFQNFNLSNFSVYVYGTCKLCRRRPVKNN